MSDTRFDVLSYLTVPWGEKRELSRFALLLSRLGDPQKAFRSVHVAGTNGKGSTCAYLDSILRAEGRRVGLYTSPSLIRLNERIRIEGADIDDEALARAAQAVCAAERALLAEGAIPCEYGGFDRLTATAFVAFLQAGVEVAVLETGLGGRLDATNVAPAEVAVLTPIGIDHAHLLGDTVELIAREKCGIIKPRQHVVCAPQELTVERIVYETCMAQGAKLTRLSPRQIEPRSISRAGQHFVLSRGSGAFMNLFTPLLGRHQLLNASVAALAAYALGCDALAVQRGIARTTWPARMEFFAAEGDGVDVLIDGAHNPHAARALLDGLDQLFANRPVVAVVAIMADKDAPGLLRILSPRIDRLIAVRCTGRSLPPEAIVQLAKQNGIAAQTATSIEDAMTQAKQICANMQGEPLLLVSGSLYLAGKVRQMLLAEST